MWWAFASLRLSPWAREGYEQGRARGLRYPLRDLSPRAVDEFRAGLVGAGVGGPTVRRAARSALLATGHVMDATLVSILAYAGLRPGEAIALRWADVGERTIRVERAVAFGEVKATKTGATRSVRPLAPLASDLREWLLARGRPEGSGLVFPAADGRPWREHDWRNWRRRRFEPAMRAAGVEGDVRPYDLRHSFCSLLLWEGLTIHEVARQAGHGPDMTLRTYGHVLDELAGAERVSAEEEIRRVRAARVPHLYPLRGSG